MSYRRHKMMQSGGIDLSKDWFRINALSDGTCNIILPPSMSVVDVDTICYSKNGKKWRKLKNVNSTQVSASISVVSGDVVYFKGVAKNYSTSGAYSKINMSSTYSIGGNIMSLLYDEDFENKSSFPLGSGYTFKRMYYNDANIISCENLKLPATTLVDYCYEEMFYNSALTTPPKTIGATNIGNTSCDSMFRGTKINKTSAMSVNYVGSVGLSRMYYGTKVTDASNITIAAVNGTNACAWMFVACDYLTTGPLLLAETPSSYCYQSMFGSRVLNYLKCLLKTNIVNGNNCLNQWMSNSASGIFVKHIDATWTTTGRSGVPSGYTIIYYDPALDKYYLDQNRDTECDDHGNVIN